MSHQPHACDSEAILGCAFGRGGTRVTPQFSFLFFFFGEGVEGGVNKKNCRTRQIVKLLTSHKITT